MECFCLYPSYVSFVCNNRCRNVCSSALAVLLSPQVFFPWTLHVHLLQVFSFAPGVLHSFVLKLFKFSCATKDFHPHLWFPLPPLQPYFCISASLLSSRSSPFCLKPHGNLKLSLHQTDLIFHYHLITQLFFLYFLFLILHSESSLNGHRL